MNVNSVKVASEALELANNGYFYVDADSTQNMFFAELVSKGEAFGPVRRVDMFGRPLNYYFNKRSAEIHGVI